MFGKVLEVPQTEKTPFYPRSPYGVSKVAAHYAVVNYRESYGIHASSAIMFNYESKFRGPEFVTRKITLAAARIKLGLQKEIRLGNIETKRDWTHASDTVRAMWLMAQKETPSDYVISSGETRTVREFLDLAFSKLGLNYQDYIVIDPKFFRPAEVDLLKGNSEKAHKELGWYPKVSFEELVEEMVKADYDFVKKLET
jgi:GDPmannose 4,6-dehydratase